MTTVPYSFRIDEDTKAEFDAICHVIGVSPSAAFNMFAKRVVAERRFPFVPGVVERPTVVTALRAMQEKTAGYDIGEDDILDLVVDGRR